jgi:hypothetical protein
MNEEEIKKLADEISFRLMATNTHPDHEWLVGRLTEAKDQLADKLIGLIQSLKSN